MPAHGCLLHRGAAFRCSLSGSGSAPHHTRGGRPRVNQAIDCEATIHQSGRCASAFVVSGTEGVVAACAGHIELSRLLLQTKEPPACPDRKFFDQTADRLGAVVKESLGRLQPFDFIGAGGVAMVFNNTVTGTTYNCRTIEVSHERSFRAFGEFAVCDGTNRMDGNQIPAGQKGAGYPCFGQPGRATDADGDGVFESSPCYAWNNTLNGEKLNMVLRPWADPEQTARQAAHVKEGRDFFNEAPNPEYYKPYTYPHPLQSAQ